MRLVCTYPTLPPSLTSSSHRRSNPLMSSVIARSSIVGAKLFNSFKKAAWIASTTVLILLVPLIIEMDREHAIVEMEKEQVSWG